MYVHMYVVCMIMIRMEISFLRYNQGSHHSFTWFRLYMNHTHLYLYN